MPITGEAGREQYDDAGSTPSISGKLGTPAMSVASSTALREVPIVGDVVGDDDWDGGASPCTGSQGRYGSEVDRPRGARLRGGEDGSSWGDNSDRRLLRSVGVVAAVGGPGEGSGCWTGLLFLMPLRQQ